MSVRLLLVTASSIATVLAWQHFGPLAFPTLLIFLVCGWAWFALVRFALRRWAQHLDRLFDQIEP
jgi:hypothetical protein